MAEHAPASTDATERQMAAMPIGDHLIELRARVIICLVSMAAAFVLCWIFRYPLMAVLRRPHASAMRAFGLSETLKYSGYFDSIVAQLRACLVAACALTAPVLIYHAWRFVGPGLFPNERFKAVKLGAACAACLMAGLCFGYFLFVPLALRYLVSLAGPGTEPVLMIGPYLSALFLLTLALGIAFQTPVIVFCLVRWGVLDPATLHRNRKAVILGAFIVGAIMTPPDPLTQVLMAVTLVVLYDLGGLAAAPRRETVLGFLRFTGLILLIVAALAAWVMLWPAGRVEALTDPVWVGGRDLAAGQTARLRRSGSCRVGEGGLARIALSGAGSTLHLKGPGRLFVRGRDRVELLSGEVLVESLDPDAPIEVLAASATVVVARGRAEVLARRADAVTVGAFSGEVKVQSGGQTRRVAAGQTDTFYAGGEPVVPSDRERKWLDLIGGAAGGP